jgi:hypothetical protein
MIFEVETCHGTSVHAWGITISEQGLTLLRQGFAGQAIYNMRRKEEEGKRVRRLNREISFVLETPTGV